MKKLKCIFLAALVLTAQTLVGCSKSSATIEEYFPVKKDTVYEYVSSPTDIANQQVFVTYTNGQMVQRRLRSQQGVSTELLQIKNGELRVTYYDPSFYFYENLFDVQPIADGLILKEPLSKGQKWKSSDGTSYEITDMKAKVSTKYGEFEAMEVTGKTSSQAEYQDIVQKDYYAKGVGLVKTEYSYQGSDSIIIELNSVMESTGLQLQVVQYYPDKSTMELAKHDGSFVMRTNIDMTGMLTLLFKSAEEFGNENILPLMPENASIRSIYVTRPEDTLYIDMSEEYRGYINGMENLMIAGLVDTVGNLYDVKYVVVAINGVLYTASGADENGRILVEREAVEKDLKITE